jgi:hypothetical protein
MVVAGSAMDSTGGFAMGFAGILSVAVVAIAIIIFYGIRKRREEWRRDYWGECYKCFKVGLIAGWRALNVSGSKRAPCYIVVPACARCRQERETRAEKGDRKIAFFPWRSAAEDLAEQMNDDVRLYGERKTAYAPEV